MLKSTTTEVLHTTKPRIFLNGKKKKKQENLRLDPRSLRYSRPALSLSCSILFLAGSDSSGGAEGGGHQKPGPLKFGMSSVLCRLETLAEKGDDNGSGEELAAFAAARGVDSLAVMTVRTCTSSTFCLASVFVCDGTRSSVSASHRLATGNGTPGSLFQ